MSPQRSRILDVGVRAVFHTLLLVSLFFLFRGHDAPGGGFAGGLVAGGAFALLWLSRDHDAIAMLPVAPETLLGLGLLVGAATGIAPLLGGGSFLESGTAVWNVALVGDVKLHSVLAFDIGVYLIVLGFVVVALDRLGDASNDEVVEQ